MDAVTVVCTSYRGSIFILIFLKLFSKNGSTNERAVCAPVVFNSFLFVSPFYCISVFLLFVTVSSQVLPYAFHERMSVCSCFVNDIMDLNVVEKCLESSAISSGFMELMPILLASCSLCAYLL